MIAAIDNVGPRLRVDRQRLDRDGVARDPAQRAAVDLGDNCDQVDGGYAVQMP